MIYKNLVFNLFDEQKNYSISKKRKQLYNCENSVAKESLISEFTFIKIFLLKALSKIINYNKVASHITVNHCYI